MVIEELASWVSRSARARPNPAPIGPPFRQPPRGSVATAAAFPSLVIRAFIPYQVQPKERRARHCRTRSRRPSKSGYPHAHMCRCGAVARPRNPGPVKVARGEALTGPVRRRTHNGSRGRGTRPPSRRLALPVLSKSQRCGLIPGPAGTPSRPGGVTIREDRGE